MARYSAVVDGEDAAAYIITPGESALVRMEGAAGETLFWGYQHEGVLDFWDVEQEAVDFADDDPYADLATQLLLDRELESPTTLRLAAGGGGGQPSCTDLCSSAQTACETRNGNLGDTDLMEPCGTLYSICLDDCTPEPIFRFWYYHW